MKILLYFLKKLQLIKIFLIFNKGKTWAFYTGGYVQFNSARQPFSLLRHAQTHKVSLLPLEPFAWYNVHFPLSKDC